MLLAAACSSSSSTTFQQVHGTVVDQRTGKPVAQARLQATAPQVATVTGSTDAQGRFTLHKVHKQATLQVTAANYQLASLPVDKGPLQVKLTPIPVLGRVTSRLTQAGLQATLRGKAGEQTQTRPDGTFQVYGMGQGDTLTVSAPGYTQKSITIGAGRVEVVLSPEPATEVNQINQWVRAGDLAAVWRFMFTDPPGYRFEDVPAEFKAKARKAYEGKPGIKGFDVRVVTHDGGSPDITVVAIAWDPKLAAMPGFEDAVLAGLVRATGAARPQTFTVRGIRVPYVASPAPGGLRVAHLLLDRSIELDLNSRDLDKLKAFVTALFTEA
jgi:hypothetical protein